MGQTQRGSVFLLLYFLLRAPAPGTTTTYDIEKTTRYWPCVEKATQHCPEDTKNGFSLCCSSLSDSEPAAGRKGGGRSYVCRGRGGGACRGNRKETRRQRSSCLGALTFALFYACDFSYVDPYLLVDRPITGVGPSTSSASHRYFTLYVMHDSNHNSMLSSYLPPPRARLLWFR